MSRETEHQFFSADANTLITNLTSAYQSIVGRVVHPASPEKLFLSWLASGLLEVYQKMNYAANQNLPSRATGENLDALAELFYQRSRPEATPAYVTMQFTISETQDTTLIIPAGTRVTNASGSPVFATVEDVTVNIGQTSAEVQAVCQTPGTSGNGYTAGQISSCVDVFPYYASCRNIDTSNGGSDAPGDDEFYNLLVASEGGWSCAGPISAYIYFAKSVSSDIADVVANTPSGGLVYIYTLMADGTPADSTIKNLILQTCNSKDIRPLTDHVVAADPVITTYNISLTYYMSLESEKSATELQNDVADAVNDFIIWQAGKLGRDINPSRLIQMVMTAGAKRVEVVSPVFTRLNDGSNNQAPGLAQVGTITLTNGGYEE